MKQLWHAYTLTHAELLAVRASTEEALEKWEVGRALQNASPPSTSVCSASRANISQA